MLNEAFYPSELSDNHPIRVFYGFVQEGIEKDYEVTLVVFYPKLTGTSLFNLSDENKAGLANFLLQKHMYGVKASFIRVAFVCQHLNENNFYAESWGVDVFEGYALDQYEARPKNLLDHIFKNDSMQVSINSRNLTIGLTNNIKLIEHRNLDFSQTEYLLERLKIEDYGNFEKIFNKLADC